MCPNGFVTKVTEGYQIESQLKTELQGDFYAIPTSIGKIIVEQPLIMSCMGCLRFDCDDNRPKTLDDQV